MGMFLQYFGSGGVIPPDLQNFLQGSISGNPIVWLIDLGDEPKDREDPRRIIPQGGPQSGGNSSKTRHCRDVGIPASGCSNYGGGNRGGGDIRSPPSEQHRPVYRDSSNTGYIYGVRTADNRTGIIEVLGAGRYRPRPRVG